MKEGIRTTHKNKTQKLTTAAPYLGSNVFIGFVRKY